MRTAILFLIVASSITFAGTTLHKSRSMGRDFYIVFPKAAWGNQSVGVLVNSPSKQNVTVTTPSGSKGIVEFTKPKTTKYYGGQFRIESIPGYRPKDATRIQSENPISVHGQFGLNGISGTYTAIPVSAWGTEYYAMAPPEGTNSGYYYYPTIYSVPMITIIASRPATKVTISPTTSTSKGYPQDVPFTINLVNAGDVYNITTQGDPAATNHYEDPCNADLTGTHIVSNYPVGVIVAQTHGTWPCGDNECGDYCVEYLPPVANWDSLYVITPEVPRLNGAVGEQLRIVFCAGGTTLAVDDVGGHRELGTYGAGDWIDYPQPVGDAIVLSGTHPFLLVMITRKPVSCSTGTSGGENWTLSMVFVPGVNQWSDYVTFSTAYGAVSSYGNLLFRASDRNRLHINGTSLAALYPIVKQLPLGFATIPMTLDSVSHYYEITGDSGAVVGGSICGYGSARFGPGGTQDPHVADPEVIKSFAHPMNVGTRALRSGDDSPPECVIAGNVLCGTWQILADDDPSIAGNSGIADVWIDNGTGLDTAFNVTVSTTPFHYGDSRVDVTITVNNPSQPARAHLYVRDLAGNEFDTLLMYNSAGATGLHLRATPATSDVGIVVTGTQQCTTALINGGLDTVHVANYRLKYGAAHHWSIVAAASATPPFLILPGDSVMIVFEYTVPQPPTGVLDEDSLLVTTCREFGMAHVLGRQKIAAITASCGDFGAARFDTLGILGDTVTSRIDNTYRSTVWAANYGTDTLVITGVSLGTTMKNAEPGFPQSDFTVDGYALSDGTVLATPATTSPWRIAPGDTVFVSVRAHPHHAGERSAYLLFSSNAQGTVNDTACLTVTGGLESLLLAANVNYGAHLYATMADSFFVMRNVGSQPFTILRDPFTTPHGSDTESFVFHPYVDPATNRPIAYDSSKELIMYPPEPARGLKGDTVDVPYRYVARHLGTQSVRVSVVMSTSLDVGVWLTGTTVQPHVAAASACPPDVITPGARSEVVVHAHNGGTDSMAIQNLDIAGDRASEWSIERVDVPSLGIALTSPPWVFPLRMGNLDTARVTLHWIPTSTALPTTLLHVTGIDRLGRHAADSTTGTYYTWSVFPYDTTLPIVAFPCMTGVQEFAAQPASHAVLSPMYPNPDPLSGSPITYSYTLAAAGHIELRLCNVMGNTVAVIATGERAAGTHTERLATPALPPGVYWCELITAGGTATREMVVVR